MPSRKRDPYREQARMQGELRYGAQQSALDMLRGDLTNRYQQDAAAQDTAFRSIAGSLRTAPVRLKQDWAAAGLDDSMLAQLAETPEGQRLMGQRARALTSFQQQELGAEQGQQFVQQRLADDYRNDVNRVNQSMLDLLREKGTFEAGIVGDSQAAALKRRQDLADTRRQQDFDREQALQSQQQSERNAWIGADIDPNTGRPLPSRSAAKPRLKAASPSTVKAATGTLSQIRPLVQAMWENGISRRAAGQVLLRGRKGSKGDPVYDEATGKRLLNPDGTQKTKGAKSELPSFAKDQPLLQAALDIAYDGRLSPATVRLLHKAYGNGIVGALRLSTNRKAPRPQRPQANPQGVFANPAQPLTIG